MFWIPLAVGAALGVGKNIEGRYQANKQRKAQGEIQKWSPWTGLQGQMVKDPSLFGDVATGAAIGGMAGGMMGGGAAGASEFAAPASSYSSMASSPSALSTASSGGMTGGFNVMGADPNFWTKKYSLMYGGNS